MSIGLDMSMSIMVSTGIVSGTVFTGIVSGITDLENPPAM